MSTLQKTTIIYSTSLIKTSMGLFDWFWKSLSFLGLFKKKANIVFLGLDNAGKSTLLAMLKNAAAAQVAPTQHPTSQVLEIGNIKFKAYDLGGHEVARRVWEEYVVSANGIIYLIDIADKSRFVESYEALKVIFQIKEFESYPILILANKIDLPQATSIDEVIATLKIGDKLTGKAGGKLVPGTRPLEIFPCSVIKQEGYAEGFTWLSKYV